MRLNITAAYVDACVKRDARVHRIATCAIFHRFRFVLFREKLSFFFFSIFSFFFFFFFFFFVLVNFRSIEDYEARQL